MLRRSCSLKTTWRWPVQAETCSSSLYAAIKYTSCDTAVFDCIPFSEFLCYKSHGQQVFIVHRRLKTNAAVSTFLHCSEVRPALTVILTYSMVQTPSWAGNRFAASQEIPRISRNPKVHYRTHKRPPSVSIPGQSKPVQYPHPTSWRSLTVISVFKYRTANTPISHSQMSVIPRVTICTWKCLPPYFQKSSLRVWGQKGQECLAYNRNKER